MVTQSHIARVASEPAYQLTETDVLQWIHTSWQILRERDSLRAPAKATTSHPRAVALHTVTATTCPQQQLLARVPSSQPPVVIAQAPAGATRWCPTHHTESHARDDCYAFQQMVTRQLPEVEIAERIRSGTLAKEWRARRSQGRPAERTNRGGRGNGAAQPQGRGRGRGETLALATLRQEHAVQGEQLRMQHETSQQLRDELAAARDALDQQAAVSQSPQWPVHPQWSVQPLSSATGVVQRGLPLGFPPLTAANPSPRAVLVPSPAASLPPPVLAPPSPSPPAASAAPLLLSADETRLVTVVRSLLREDAGQPRRARAEGMLASLFESIDDVNRRLRQVEGSTGPPQALLVNGLPRGEAYLLAQADLATGLSISGHLPPAVIVDTGSMVTVATSELVQRLGLGQESGTGTALTTLNGGTAALPSVAGGLEVMASTRGRRVSIPRGFPAS